MPAREVRERIDLDDDPYGMETNGEIPLYLGFFDILGFKKFSPKERKRALLKLWAKTKNYPSQREEKSPQYSGHNDSIIVPKLQFFHISDAIFLKVLSNIGARGLFKEILDYKRYIEDGQNGLRTYVIINEGYDLERPLINNANFDHGREGLGFNVICGDSECWPEIYEADIALKEFKDWHKQYSIYSLIKENIPNNIVIADEKQFEYYGASKSIYALDYT